jgi:hypothetical protein
VDFAARNELRKSAILLLQHAREQMKEHPDIEAKAALADAYRREIERHSGDPARALRDGTETLDSLALARDLAAHFISTSGREGDDALALAESHLEQDRGKAE